MTIVLSPGAEQPKQAEPRPVAATEPLSAAETQALLDRLPPLPVEADDEQEFRLPPESLPAPRTGDVITETFPPPESPLPPGGEAEAGEPGPLEVLRYAPEGEIPIAPFLSVTFNQPMVPLATIEQLAAEEVPVKLTPELPGVWKWIGTRTLTFEYAGDVDRFPKATEYTAEVPAGTTSAVGGVLGESVRWTFRTPPPVVVNSYPGYGPQPRNPLMFVAFDQQIDPEAVLETITVRANRQTFPVRLGGEEELAAREEVARLAERAGEGRWLTFRTLDTLPADATVTVSIGPGTPSAEGPLVTEEVQSFGFQTYAPLRLEESWCSYGSQECPPFAPFNPSSTSSHVFEVTKVSFFILRCSERALRASRMVFPFRALGAKRRPASSSKAWMTRSTGVPPMLAENSAFPRLPWPESNSSAPRRNSSAPIPNMLLK
jgi:hypothetical protein